MHRDHSAWALEACVEAGRAPAAFLRPVFEQRWSCRRRRRRGRRCSRTMEGSSNSDLRARYDCTSIYTNMTINLAHILMMRGWCFGIGCTVLHPRSIRQIIGRSHRRRPLVHETSVGPSQLSTSADDFSMSSLLVPILS